MSGSGKNIGSGVTSRNNDGCAVLDEFSLGYTTAWIGKATEQVHARALGVQSGEGLLAGHSHVVFPMASEISRDQEPQQWSYERGVVQGTAQKCTELDIVEHNANPVMKGRGLQTVEGAAKRQIPNDIESEEL